MKKKNLMLVILGLALILAFAFAGCELIDLNKTNERPSGDTPPNATITLRPSQKYQYVRGFGGMDITWDNFFEISLAEYDKMYHPDQLGFNIMRIMINPIKGRGPNVTPDGPTAEDRKFVHTTDPLEFLSFITSSEGGRPNYFEGVKKVNSYGGYVLASPWSPPRAWKTNDSIAAGKLKTEHYQDYTEYLKIFARKMKDEGAPIYAISIQNEPNYDNSKENYEGCGWSDAEMRDFFLQAGDFTQGITGWGGSSATDRVLIMSGESANTPTIHNAAMTNTTARGIIDLLARHNYGRNSDTPHNPGLEHGKEMWMSEMNINGGNEASFPKDFTWDYVWLFLNDLDMSIRGRSDNAYIWWALKRFYSFIGEGGPRGYGTTEGDILPRGYAMSHYAKFAKEKTRIGVEVRGTLKDGTPIGTSNVNNTSVLALSQNEGGYSVRVTAFISESGNELSVVMYTPTLKSGEYGYDLGKVRIDLPTDFIETNTTVTAMRSSATVKAQPETPALIFDRSPNNNNYYVIVTLPRSEILSIKFTKQ